ncbi:protein crumbs isoform X5 [Neodiprion virginianus]|uniref:protein crumbs isoform X5 n=1 Tax=Neodiprion virginianus TaxID=2961670 RepID=UPI001EE69E15|nr:protein crumbs isoform X5 [Neodiprion virginianus]
MRVLAAVAVFSSLLITTFEAPQDAISYDTDDNYREAYFNGSAYLRLASTVSVHRQTGLSFRTCDGGRLFIQHFGPDFISLEVTPEGLLFLASVNQQRYEAKLNAKLLNNAWHYVNLLFRLGNFTLSAAGHTQVIANGTYNSGILNLPDYNDNEPLIIGEGFKGCILQGPGILFRRNSTINNGAVFGTCPLESAGCGPLSVGGLATVTVPTSDFCDHEPCMMHGTCVSRQDRYECHCFARYSGNNCQLDNGPPCDSNPCQNGGSCTEDSRGNYSCTCIPGFTGTLCDSQLGVSLCERNPCENDGTCYNVADGEYKCECSSGWTGKNCEININECASNPCKHGGTCTDSINNYTCRCDRTGYRGINCEINIDECLNNPCLNNGECFDNYGGYICQCPMGFEGQNCELNLNECLSNPCTNGGSCIDEVGTYHCNCLSGYTGRHCELHGLCENGACPPNSICIPDNHGPQCVCNPGFMGIPPNCTINFCANNPCLNGGTCTSNQDGFNCTCPIEWTGTACDQDVDECATYGNSLCNNGICVNTNGSYDCFCRPGFSGDHCDMEIDECLCGPCKNNATCIDRINAFECSCQDGYAGKTCEVDVDECLSNPCINGATCIDNTAFYSCICSLGFTGNNCEINIDDCQSSPCLNYGECIDGINNYTCNCTDTGFEGANCEFNIDDCLSAPCMNGAKCVDGILSYNCQCYDGYTGLNCEKDVDECESSPCQFNGTCLERSNRELYKSNASTLPAIFTRNFSYENASGYECICVSGVIGKNCEININECESNPCVTGTCMDRIGGYKCECDDGFEGTHCQTDIDECKKYTPCEHGTCLDGKADYSCICDPGFGGKNCSVPLIGCQGNACQNGGTCWPYLVDETEHRFNCTCPNGFHGEMCDIVTTMSLNGKSYVLVNTSRDEGYDIQFRFRTTLPDGLIAMGKGSTFYILELVNGKLNLHSSILNRWEGVFIGTGLNNSEWQKVFVAINTTHIVLSANEEQTIYPINLNEGNASHTSFPTTYIGGTITYLSRLTHGPAFFIGCTEDVIINGEWIYTGLQSSSVQMVDVESGCPRTEQCLPNPCKNGGHCTDRWQNFSCKCERPYLGHTCQYNMTAATFGYGNITDGYVTVKVNDLARRAIRSIVDISMFIRTRQDTGDIFYLGSESSAQFDGKQEKPYIRALLEHGELLVQIQFNGSEAYTVGGVKLNQGNYHLIQVVRNVTLVQVKINGSEYFRKTIGATGQSNVTVLYLGGLPRQTPRSSRQADNRQTDIQQAPQTNFKGIIQDVQISNGSETMVVEFYPLKAKDIPTLIEFGTVILDKEKILEGVVSDPVCNSNPCYHNGTCHVTWNDFWCQCPRGYTGKMCQEMEFCQLQDCPTGSRCQNLDDGYECVANATFNGSNDLLTYTYKQSEEQNGTESTTDTIEITYRSRTGGVLMHIAPKSGNQNFAVSVFRDNISISWILDYNNHGTLSFGKNEPDGNWTSIVIKLNNDSIESGYANSNDETIPHSSPNFSFSLWYELLCTGTVTLGGLGGELSDRNSYVTIGTNSTYSGGNTVDGNSVEYPQHMMTTATPPHSFVLGDAFKGCLGEVRIGAMLLHYFTYDEVYQNANFTPTEYLSLQVVGNLSSYENIGCRLCFESDCKNGGHCLNEANSYICDCLPGYAEDDCSVDIDECIDNKCKHGAMCVDKIANYTCECTSGWQSWLCDEDINECVSVTTCQHDGVCVNLPGSFRCECPDQFTGNLCEEVRIITCADHKCKNGSTCTDVVDTKTGNNFTCTCMPGFEGQFCDTPYCMPNKCQHGGRCDYLYQTPQCTCVAGYTGMYCETDIDDCAADTNGNVPCKNGGKCLDGVNNFKCDCSHTGYNGSDCSIDIDECAQMPVNCENGHCENLPGSYQCSCIPGYCGRNCEVLDPCIQTPCQNEGTCTCLDDSGYICHCTSDYGGHNCTEQKLSLGSQALDIAVIVGPIVGCLLLIGAGSLIALFMMARKKRATRGTYSPSAQEFSNPRVEMDNVMKPPPEERLI